MKTKCFAIDKYNILCYNVHGYRRNSADKLNVFLLDRRTSNLIFPPRLKFPEQFKTKSMPLDDGIGLNDDQIIFPVSDELRK